MAAPNYNDPEYLKYLEKMKVALVQVESGGKNIKNPIHGVTATGYYQYNITHLDTIKAHAKKLGMTVNNMDDFQKNEALQHSYFAMDQYNNFKFAKENLNNGLGLNLEELGYLAHWQGDKGARRVIENNKLPSATYVTNKDGKRVMSNPDGKIVMGRLTKQLKDNGIYESSAYQKNMLRVKEDMSYKEFQRLSSMDGKDTMSEAERKKYLKLLDFRYELYKDDDEVRKLPTEKFEIEIGKRFDKAISEKYNENSIGGISYEEKQKIQKQYDDELKKINDSNELPLNKGLLIKALNKKFYDEGNAGIVNQKIDYRNNKESLKSKRLYELRSKKKNAFITDFKRPGPVSLFSKEEEKELEELEKKYLEASKKAIALNPNATEKDIQMNLNAIGRSTPINLKAFDDADKKVYDNQQEENENPIESSSESESSSNTKYNEQYPYDGSKKEADAVKKGMTDNEYLASLNGLQSDPKFNYVEGKTQIPLEAGIGLLAGISGMNAANEQPGMRDEEIDESLLQFASMQQKIAKMGLAPEAEAALKNDLASMYQTSHDNMVKASAGNRNLVLGNQGQADQARMEGLSKIALMDLDARQKGMEAYGRVAEYMSSFKAQKDIANNERQYAEFQKRQSAGVAVAEKGFGLLIDSLKTARDTGPGSAHDMYMQKMKFSLTGVNERIPDNGLGDTPMTQSYVDRLATERKEKDASDQSKKDFFWGLPVEKRQAWKDLSEQYPEASLDDLRTKFDSPESVVEKKANETPTLSELNRYVTLTPEQLADERSALENPMPEKGTFSPPGPKRMYNGLSTDEQPEPDLNALEKSNAKQRTETDKEIASYSANLASVSGVSESQIKDEANQQKLKAEELLRQSEENIKRTELATQAILLENEKQGKAIDNVTASARQ